MFWAQALVLSSRHMFSGRVCGMTGNNRILRKVAVTQPSAAAFSFIGTGNKGAAMHTQFKKHAAPGAKG